MSLLRDIQKAATSSDTKLTDLLRMCQVLASRLGNAELAKWVASELNGYESYQDLPKYRIFDAECRGDFFNGAWLHKASPISPSWVEKEHVDSLFHVYLMQGIGALESIKPQGDKPLCVPWAGDMTIYYRDKFSSNGYDLQNAYRVLAPSEIVGLLDTVRTRVLSFALDIERAAPHAGDEKPGEAPALPQERVTQIFNLNIKGGTNNIAAGSSHFTQSIDVVTGDLGSLRRVLEKHGVPKEDIDEIAEIVRTEKLKGNILGSRALTWIGKMSGKAVAGLWSGGIAAGAEVLTKALLAYHGIQL